MMTSKPFGPVDFNAIPFYIFIGVFAVAAIALLIYFSVKSDYKKAGASFAVFAVLAVAVTGGMFWLKSSAQDKVYEDTAAYVKDITGGAYDRELNADTLELNKPNTWHKDGCMVVVTTVDTDNGRVTSVNFTEAACKAMK